MIVSALLDQSNNYLFSMYSYNQSWRTHYIVIIYHVSDGVHFFLQTFVFVIVHINPNSDFPFYFKFAEITDMQASINCSRKV